MYSVMRSEWWCLLVDSADDPGSMGWTEGGKLTAMEAAVWVYTLQEIPAIINMELAGEGFPVRVFTLPAPSQKVAVAVRPGER